MKYIVIGGDGFVGEKLVENLLGEQLPDGGVLVCDLQQTKQHLYANGAAFLRVDVTKPETLAQIPFEKEDVVIHLAANQYHRKVPREGRREYFFATNTEGTRHVLEAMEKAGCHKLVYFSTDMTYGRPQFLPVTIDHPQVPFGPYGASKKASEDLCRAYREKGFQITIFRPRMILGPGRLGILKKLFRLMEHNLPVPMIGDGSNCYQMISVFDCVSAIRKAIEKGIPNSEYNLGSENPPTVYHLLGDVIREIGSHSTLLRTNAKFDKKCLALLGKCGIELMYREQYEIADENYIVDIEHTKKDLDWEPQYNDTDMLYEAYEYYKNNPTA